MIAAGEASPAETRDYARVIVEATERMTRIIRQLLDFARRKPATKKTVCALLPLSERTLDLLRPLAAKNDVRLEVVRDATREVVVPADASALEQVLTNLVVNAVQAMRKPGTVKVVISEETSAPPDVPGAPAVRCAVLRVVDDGNGIEHDDLPHVFEPFFTTKDVGEGTGLGLSVAYGIAQDHGGWITAESKLGEGSTFTVCLPLAAGGPSEE
jgi:signal transduction histidine kinase